jgi:hypothetical protein
MHQQENRGGNNRQRAKNLRETAAAHFTNDPSGYPDSRRPGKRWEQSQSQERITKKVTRDPGHEPNQRGLIDVAPVEMLPASEIIKLIAKNSVTPCG